MRKEDKKAALDDVTARVVTAFAGRGADERPLDEVLAEAIYLEERRLKAEADSKLRRSDASFWREAKEQLRGGTGRELERLLERAVRRYAEEIAGHFDPRVYQAVTKAGPPALSMLLHAVSPKRLLSQMGNLPSLDDAVILQGQTEQVRRLHEIGTVVLMPTHVSNMDSIVVGYALYKLGLPPFVYGAGLNLFTNPLMGFFMHHLGAYTVDRKKRDPLYKEVLKCYAAATLEHGYDNIFFPGGTRSRSGAIEQRLKLGLAGTAVSAYTSNLKRKKKAPRIFMVPATLSFQLVLEAETLIDDFLRDVGKSRYVISDDEFSQPRRIFDFITQLFELDSKIFFTVGSALDPFGNPVNEDGESVDPGGRRIDIERYLLRDGEIKADPQRDAEYTREVGHQVSRAYLEDNVIQATNVTARAMFGALRKHNRRTDLLRLLRAGGQRDFVHMSEIHEATDGLLRELRALASKGKLRLDPICASATAEDVVADGLRHFAIYHTKPAIQREGDLLIPRDRQLLFYYQNRLEGYGVWPEPDLLPALSRDHRALGATA